MYVRDFRNFTILDLELLGQQNSYIRVFLVFRLGQHRLRLSPWGQLKPPRQILPIFDQHFSAQVHENPQSEPCGYSLLQGTAHC